MAMYTSIVARVLLSSRDIFVQVRKVISRSCDFLIQVFSVIKNIITGNQRFNADYRNCNKGRCTRKIDTQLGQCDAAGDTDRKAQTTGPRALFSPRSEQSTDGSRIFPAYTIEHCRDT